MSSVSGRLIERARAAVFAQLEELDRRGAEIGSAPPPQLTLVCVVA